MALSEGEDDLLVDEGYRPRRCFDVKIEQPIPPSSCSYPLDIPLLLTTITSPYPLIYTTRSYVRREEGTALVLG
jgi:hypothetical protein